MEDRPLLIYTPQLRIRRQRPKRLSAGPVRLGLSLRLQEQQAQATGDDLLHVRPVSTVRRSRAMNSADCISCRREAVRGNSWASGPSVYSPSG